MPMIPMNCHLLSISFQLTIRPEKLEAFYQQYRTEQKRMTPQRAIEVLFIHS
jgi:hypothetical protein